MVNVTLLQFLAVTYLLGLVQAVEDFPNRHFSTATWVNAERTIEIIHIRTSFSDGWSHKSLFSSTSNNITYTDVARGRNNTLHIRRRLGWFHSSRGSLGNTVTVSGRSQGRRLRWGLRWGLGWRLRWCNDNGKRWKWRGTASFSGRLG
jgi:hypothetical protein